MPLALSSGCRLIYFEVLQTHTINHTLNLEYRPCTTFCAACAHVAHVYMHTATAQTIVYTSMAQTVGWAYASLQITPLQDFCAEMGGGGAFTPGQVYTLNFTARAGQSCASANMLCDVCENFTPCCVVGIRQQGHVLSLVILAGISYTKTSEIQFFCALF